MPQEHFAMRSHEILGYFVFLGGNDACPQAEDAQKPANASSDPGLEH